ncbi:hypothetical protein [Ruegeria sp. A3M17]|uniref:hypothetical protein n=1 Tax=Ruegeria sp. A3M17 TaxID=2267229 RepID=UPI000DE95FAA|nr:hypothetical protein [Ruegeria sp. A3M17]RBW53025.1 hypothetical protein DS906_18805 [Ruegeria sp. A3M17]
MTEIDETALHCSTLVGRMAHSLKLRFTRNEAWALKVAKKVPVMGFFTFGTLWVWFFLPMIPVGIFCVWLLENAGVIGAIASTVLGVGGLAIVAPWFFRWYFICVGLIFGRKRMALSKEDQVSSRLKCLQGGSPFP